jgi:dTDP-4-amino-4,6-dideoxygalactose transaminase
VGGRRAAVARLEVIGRERAMAATRVPLVRPDLGDAEAEAAARVVRSGWVTQGPEVARFEEELSAALGAPHVVAVANCTAAIELALRVLGVQPGDDVVTASHSFIATANAVVAVGARPVFADVDEATLGLDPEAVEAAITPRTRAVLCVHQLGMPCDLGALAALTARRGIALVEDAACAIGSAIEWEGRWERIGRPRGAIACFSFHPRKVVTTGDGGALTTADPDVAKRLRLLRQHAMTIPDTVRHQTDRVVFEQFVEPAFNHRMTDVQAAIGRPQLARLDASIAERRRLADVYRAALEKSEVLAPPDEPRWARSNWQSYAARLRPAWRGGQVAAMQHFLDRGIATRRGVANAHQEPAYAGTSRFAAGPLSRSEALRDTTILLPLFHGMSTAEQGAVLEAVADLPSALGRAR